MPKDTALAKAAAKRTAKAKPTRTAKIKATRTPRIKYIGRNRETSVCGITFELNRAVPVPDAALFAKLSRNPYFEVASDDA